MILVRYIITKSTFVPSIVNYMEFVQRWSQYWNKKLFSFSDSKLLKGLNI